MPVHEMVPHPVPIKDRLVAFGANAPTPRRYHAAPGGWVKTSVPILGRPPKQTLGYLL
jgi:hypothetical protein